MRDVNNNLKNKFENWYGKTLENIETTSQLLDYYYGKNKFLEHEILIEELLITLKNELIQELSDALKESTESLEKGEFSDSSQSGLKDYTIFHKRKMIERNKRLIGRNI